MPDQNPPNQNPTGQPQNPAIPNPATDASSAPPLTETPVPTLPADDIAMPTPKDETGSGAPPFDIPPVVTTEKPAGNNRKIVATILGLLVLVGGITAGVVLVRQQQVLREEAAGCGPDNPELCIPGAGGGGEGGTPSGGGGGSASCGPDNPELCIPGAGGGGGDTGPTICTCPDGSACPGDLQSNCGTSGSGGGSSCSNYSDSMPCPDNYHITGTYPDCTCVANTSSGGTSGGNTCTGARPTCSSGNTLTCVDGNYECISSSQFLCDCTNGRWQGPMCGEIYGLTCESLPPATSGGSCSNYSSTMSCMDNYHITGTYPDCTCEANPETASPPPLAGIGSSCSNWSETMPCTIPGTHIAGSYPDCVCVPDKADACYTCIAAGNTPAECAAPCNITQTTSTGSGLPSGWTYGARSPDGANDACVGACDPTKNYARGCTGYGKIGQFTDASGFLWGYKCDTTTTTTTTGGGGGDGGDGGPTPTLPPGVTAQCLNIKAFDSSWNQLSASQLSNLKVGDTVRFTVAASASTGTFDQARFTINSTARTAVTQKRPGTQEFYDEYVIAAGTTTISVTAKIHNTVLGWF